MPRSSVIPVNPRVAVYCRVSSDDQAERQTIDAQRDFLAEYVRIYGLDCFAVYADDGVSGTLPLPDRPEARRMLADARAGCFGAVLVYRLDRLGRNLRALLAAHDDLSTCGVSIRSATEPFDTATPIGQFLFQLLGSLAELEKSTILERTTMGRDRVARQGKWTNGSVMFGYDTDADGRLVASERVLPHGATEADSLRELFRRIASGSTLFAEARRLEALGVPSIHRWPGRADRIGRHWWPTRIHKIIKNPAYKGEYVLDGRNGPVPVPIPALVDADLWGRAQAAMTANRDLSSSPGTRAYLLRGLVRCRSLLADGTVCGRAYNGAPGSERMADGTQRLYYHCSGGRGHAAAPDRPRCPGRSIPMAVLDDRVWSDVSAFVRSPGPRLEEAHAALLAARPAPADRTAEREGLHREIAARRAERERAQVLFRRGLADIDETEAAIRGCDAAIRTAEGLLAGLDAERAADEAQADHISAVALMIGDLLPLVAAGDAGDREARRVVLARLVREVSVATTLMPRTRRRQKREQKRVAATLVYRFGPVPMLGSIPSGLARGIDTHAHRATLAAGGRTIAVLGSGLDRVYPDENRALAEQIELSGAVLSEFPLGAPPDAMNFPRRNRIISGLAKATLVVEADLKSGAMGTATYAAEQGRDVFAMPGSIFNPLSAGPHQLIREGARIVTDASDILEELHLTAVVEERATREALPADPTEAALLRLLSDEPTHVDDLTRAAALPSSTVTATLTILELKGLARQFGAMLYVRA